MKSLTDAAQFFGQLAAGGYKRNLLPILDLIGNSVKAEVEKEIGEYQGAIGPYPATAPLAEATLERKSKAALGKGGLANSPLWATGKFHDSIETAKNVTGLEVEIGTNVDYVINQELGTSKIPPRPVFGPATLRVLPKLLPTIAAAGAAGIKGGAWKGLSAEGIAYTSKGMNTNLLP